MCKVPIQTNPYISPVEQVGIDLQCLESPAEQKGSVKSVVKRRSETIDQQLAIPTQNK